MESQRHKAARGILRVAEAQRLPLQRRPTGAKGMNLAFADVMMLSRAVSAFYKDRRNDLLEAYSAICLRRVWKAQRFSWWMTQIMHRFPHETAFDRRRQLSDLDYLTGSKAAATSLAEQYVGLPLD